MRESPDEIARLTRNILNLAMLNLKYRHGGCGRDLQGLDAARIINDTTKQRKKV